MDFDTFCKSVSVGCVIRTSLGDKRIKAIYKDSIMIRDDVSGVVQFICRDILCDAYKMAHYSLRALIYTGDCVIVPNA